MKHELPEKMEAWLQAALANNRFANETEAFEYLVDLDVPDSPDDIKELRRLWQEGIDSGTVVDGPAAMKELWQRVEAKRQA